MDEILGEVVPDEELKKFERIYYEQATKNTASKKAQFEYASCLVRSKYPADIKKGIILLEDLFNNDVPGRRDYLYYLAIGNTRIREYNNALKYCRVFLEIEPTNTQVQTLESVIKKKMNKEGRIGLAITMAGVLIMGGLVSLGVTLSRSRS